MCAGGRIYANGFDASRISGSDNWRIDALPGSDPPTTNGAPTAIDDTGPDVNFGESVTIQATKLLENDTDPDGDSLTITAVTAAQHGTVTLAGETITFTHDGESDPAQGYTFTYTVSDGEDTDTATVSGAVTLKPVPALPAAGVLLLGGMLAWLGRRTHAQRGR
jgi:hypothetical protein